MEEIRGRFPEVTSLKDNHTYKGEPPVIYYNGNLVEASRFGTMGFQEVCQLAGFSRTKILDIMLALADEKGIFGYKEVVARKTGEPYYTHPMAVALIDIIEFGNRDPNLTIGELGHDTPEDSYMMLGNENHPHRTGVHEVFTTLEALTRRYGEVAAKIMLSLCKPTTRKSKKEMSPIELQDYLYGKYAQVLNKYPEVRVLAAKAKTVDHIHSKRAPADDKFMAEKILEDWRFVLPIATYAGEAYRETLKTELEALKDILTPEQKALCTQQVTYTLAT